MRTRTSVALVTLAVAAPAFALSPALFPPSPEMAPMGAQRPLFVGLGAVYALALGLGVAFAVFGLPAVRRLMPSAPGRAMAVYLTIAWLLVSWYPHGGLHASVGMDAGSLLWIEYGFHLPLILAPLVLIWASPGLRRRRRRRRRRAQDQIDGEAARPPYESFRPDLRLRDEPVLRGVTHEHHPDHRPAGPHRRARG